uniref:Amidohydrolase-related domain-containing protein n=1 Tax=Clastoptera arizonana TaxID=38151 RepID=A0A1B6CCK2_9HEMI
MNHSSDEILQFINCTLLRNHKIIIDDLWVRNGKIINPEKLFFEEKCKASKKINCQGALISPGYIDVQINGGFGTDFSYNIDDTERGLSNVAKKILAHGVTSFCPTLVTSSSEVYKKVLPKIQKKTGGHGGAAVLGVHLEGPFISPDKKGAHNLNEIKDFTQGYKTVIDIYGSLENVAIITLAPELPNAMEVIGLLVKKGITVSLGHSTADIKIGEEGARNGATLITHLFNAMLPVSYFKHCLLC